jgi:hypothetical protein
MKTRTLTDRVREDARHTPRQPKRAAQSGGPVVAERVRGLKAPARCERCDARYEDKVWRTPTARQKVADLEGVTWTLCPACRQIEDQEYFGRVRVTRPLSPEMETQVRRRVWNVERRARHTQPEHRLVDVERRREGLEVYTTSQKLAHRIAHELAKAFGGRTHYDWTEREGVLQATWTPGPERAASRTAASPRRGAPHTVRAAAPPRGTARRAARRG